MNGLKDKEHIKIKILDIGILILAIIACIFSAYAIENEILKNSLCLSFTLVVLIQIIRLLHKKQESSWQIDKAPKIQSICLLNEEDEMIREWDVFNKIAIIIGRSSKEQEVDIDLSECTYATLVDLEHAVLNLAAGEWYIEDLYSKNGVYIQKPKDQKKYMLSKDSPCKVAVNDSIYIGKTKLILK